MGTKTCKNCGWVVALRDPSNYCYICGGMFDKRICSVCGETYDTWAKRSVCKKCYKNVTKAGHSDALTQRRKAVYQEWLDKVKQVPTDYPRLTEKQWMEAVNHFGHCALCKDESIDTRGYFIPFKSGGRYCDWNVIPLCSKCAMAAKSNYNWFVAPKRPPGLMDIIDYLEVKLDAAIKKSEDIR